MQYNLGAVGLGHWFSRLYTGLRDTREIRVAKVAGVSTIQAKRERLDEMGLSTAEYYQIGKGSPIPAAFYDGLDIVHISDPNEYHAEQTIDSLSRGKLTITEKTWAVNRAQFDSVMRFIRKNRLESRAYLHLHYLHKLLTIQLDELLSRYTAEHGKVSGVAETFFEPESAEDARRSRWLFDESSGGLFMDWIHTFEIVMNGAKADSARIERLGLFAVNRGYSKDRPTGIEAEVAVSGTHFARGATSMMRIAKGTKEGVEAVRFNLEDGAHLDLGYLHAEEEASSKRRGRWTLYSKEGKALGSGSPSGPNTSELFVKEILELCKGRQTGLKPDEVAALFEPQWQYQEMERSTELEVSGSAIEAFLSRGLKLEA